MLAKYKKLQPKPKRIDKVKVALQTTWAEAPEPIRGSGGRLTTEGHVGGTAWEYAVWGWGGQNSKPSKNNIITLLLYCTVSQAHRHIQTHSHVQFKCSSISHSNCPKYILR